MRVKSLVQRDYYECPRCYLKSYNPNDIENLYCGRCHQFAEDLRDEEVTDFKHITNLHLTRRDCWTLAMLTLFQIDDPRCRLVHGWVKNSWTGEWVRHAWCETPATATYEDGSEAPIIVAIDHTQIDQRARIVRADFLYEQTGARDMKRFTREEAVQHGIVAGHDGPWAVS